MLDIMVDGNQFTMRERRPGGEDNEWSGRIVGSDEITLNPSGCRISVEFEGDQMHCAPAMGQNVPWVDLRIKPMILTFHDFTRQ